MAAVTISRGDASSISFRSMPITNRAPGRLMINLNALEGLRDPWRIPQAARDRATVIIDKDGEHGPGAIKAAAGSASSPAPASR